MNIPLVDQLQEENDHLRQQLDNYVHQLAAVNESNLELRSEVHRHHQDFERWEEMAAKGAERIAEAEFLRSLTERQRDLLGRQAGTIHMILQQIKPDHRTQIMKSIVYQHQKHPNLYADPITERQRMLDIIKDLVFEDSCEFDHHGYCQTHCWFESDPPCPHQRAKQLLEETNAHPD